MVQARRRSSRFAAMALLACAVALAPAGSVRATPGDTGLTVTTSPSGPQPIGSAVTVIVDDSYSCNYTDVTFTYTMRVIGPNAQTQSVTGKELVTFSYVGTLPGVDTIVVTANGRLSFFGPCQSAWPRHGSTTHIWTL